MSFILDALRKSEHERDRHILPGVVQAPRSGRSSGSLRWIVFLCIGAFVLNLAALAYVLLREPRAAGSTATSGATTATTPTDRRAAEPRAVSIAPASGAASTVRPLAEEAMATGRTAPYTDVPPTPHTRPLTRGREAMNVPAPVAPVTATNVEPDPSVAGLPTRRQLPAALASALPALSVDLHVYSPQPAQRFMVISGQRAVEGGTIAGGIVVERITPDGAVAVFRGTRFLLTRE